MSGLVTCGIKHVSWYQQSPKPIVSTNGKKLKSLSCLVVSKKLLKLFWQKVNKLSGSIIKLPECLKMSIIYFRQFSCKNSDITALFVDLTYQIFRCFAKWFTFTGSTSCLKFLCYKCRTKHFWTRHFNYWKRKTVFLMVKQNVKFLMFNFNF